MYTSKEEAREGLVEQVTYTGSSNDNIQSNYENLIFEGGGVKGLAYVGALEVLEEQGILKEIKRVAGTSAGAMTALLLGLGYTTEESRKKFESVFFELYKVKNTILNLHKVALDLINNYGIESAGFFSKWAEELIEEKLGSKDATFKDLYTAIRNQKGGAQFKSIYFVGANLSTGFYEIFSYDHTPNMKISDAVRISMSIPLVFTAQRFSSTNSAEKDLYVDGGILNNYPLHIFDRNGQPNIKTLGFRVDSAEEIKVLHSGETPERRKINSLFKYATSLYQTIQNVNDNIMRRGDDKIRTVFIDVKGVNALSFKIDNAKKEEIIEEGRRATRLYLQFRPQKIKTDQDRLAKVDRKKLYDKADEVYLYPIDNDTTRIAYLFTQSDLRTLNKYIDRLKLQSSYLKIDVWSGATNDNVKLIEIISTREALEEIGKWESKVENKKVLEGKVLDNIKEIEISSWKNQEYVEQKVTKREGIGKELYDAVNSRNLGKVIDLVTKGISYTYKDQHGRTALHIAAEYGYQEILRELLEKDSSCVDSQDSIKETPLHLAVSSNNISSVEILLRYGANPNIQNSYGATALHRAVRYESKESAVLLIRNGADSTITDQQGRTAKDCTSSQVLKLELSRLEKGKETYKQH